MTQADLTTEVKYFGAKIGEDFKLIGYVDIKHVDTLVFHANLTQRELSEVEGLSAEDIQALAQTEADTLTASEECTKQVNDYITLFNLGLYGQ
jgi:hypothetical protein